MTLARPDGAARDVSPEAEPDGTGPSSRGLRRRLALLVSIAIVAAVPRLALVTFGLPDINHPDEPTNITVAETMAEDGSLLPHRYNYPSFLYDCAALLLRAANALGVGSGGDPVLVRLGLFDARAPQPGLVVALRLCTVLASVALAVVVAAAVYRVVGQERDRRTALLSAFVAGAVLALSPTAIESGVYIAPDTYSGLFCGLALIGALAVLRRGAPRDYLLCGIAVGLATGSKYNAALVGVSLVVAHLVRWGRRAGSGAAGGRLLLGVAAAAGALLVTTPALLVEPRAVWRDISFERLHYSAGQPGHEGSSPLAYSEFLLTRNPAMLLLAVAAVVLAIRVRRYRREVLVVGSFALIYLGLIFAQEVHFERNLLPLLPALALLAGLGVAGWRPVQLPLVSGIALAVTALIGITTTVALRPDLDMPARAEAERWVQGHLPPTALIVQEASGPWLDPAVWTGVEPRFAAIDEPLPPAVDAVVLTEQAAGLYEADPERYAAELARYAEIRRSLCPGARFDDRGPWIEILVACR